MTSKRPNNTLIRSTSRTTHNTTINQPLPASTSHGSLNIVYLSKYATIFPLNSSLSSKIPEKYRIDPLLNHLYYCELESLLHLTQTNHQNNEKNENNIEGDNKLWFVEDLASDYEEVSNAIFHDKSYTSIFNHTIYYPHSDMLTAGVITWDTKENKADNDAFLKMLSAVYKGTQRGSSASNSFIRKKITFLSKEGIALKSIEFSTEKDYWGLIYAIKRYIDGQDTSFTGKCSLTSTNPSSDDTTFITTPSKAITRPSGLFSKLTTTTLTSHVDSNTKDELSNLSLELNDGTIKLSDKSIQVLSFKLDDLRAIAITVDCPKPSPYLLKINLNEETNNMSIQFNDVSNLTSIVSSKTKPPLTQSLLLPLTLDQIEKGCMSEEVSLLDPEKKLPSSVTILSNLAIISGNLESAVLGESIIPYASFLSNSPGLATSLLSNQLFADTIVSNDILSKRVKIGETISLPTPLKEVSARRGVRICIHNAVGLPSSSARGTQPSAYCTVYLVGKNDDKLSLNTIESRTEIIEKTSDPVWEKDIILEGGEHVPGIDTSGLEGVVGVMVKLRDASSGILKHHHIGQVVIPINCFIYQTEAKFTLPLEPTYRMTKDDTKYLGEISLTTELVTLESTLKVGQDLINGHQIDAELQRTRRLSIVSPREHSHYLAVRKPGTDGMKTAIVSYTLYDSYNISYIWWPFKTLFGGDASGHIQVNHEQLLIKLLPGAGGVLTNCKECDTIDTTKVFISWNQITQLASISDGVFMITFTVSHCTSLPSEKAKGELFYSPVNLDLLIAPCPSIILEKVIQDRLQVWSIRSKLMSFTNLYKNSEYGTQYVATHQKMIRDSRDFKDSNVIRENSNSGNNSKDTREDRESKEPFNDDVSNGSQSPKHSSGSRLNLSLSTNNNTNSMNNSNNSNSSNMSSNAPSPISSPVAPNRSRTSALWSSATITPPQQQQNTSCKMLLIEAKTLFRMIEFTLSETIDSITQMTGSDPVLLRNIDSIVNKRRSILRYYIYLSQLMLFCKQFSDTTDGPSYRLDYIHKIVDEDCSDAQILTPLRAEANPQSLADRHDYIFDMAVQRLREILICSGNDWGRMLDKNNKFIEVYSIQQVQSSNQSHPSNASTMPVPSTPMKAIPKPIGTDKKTNEKDSHIFVHGIASIPTNSTGVATSSSSSAAGAGALSSSSTSNTILSPPMAKRCIEELLGGYNNALRLSLFPYINNKVTFNRIEGQAMKNTILRLIIDTNSRLHDVASSTLNTIGMTLYPSVTLLENNLLEEIIEWYSQNLIYETRLWLSKTIQQAITSKGKDSVPKNINNNSNNNSNSNNTAKENTEKDRNDKSDKSNASALSTKSTDVIGIPWDIDTVGTKIISHLPETMAIQLRIYLDLCYTSQKNKTTSKNSKRKNGRNGSSSSSGSISDRAGDYGFRTTPRYKSIRQNQHNDIFHTSDDRNHRNSASSTSSTGIDSNNPDQIPVTKKLAGGRNYDSDDEIEEAGIALGLGSNSYNPNSNANISSHPKYRLYIRMNEKILLAVTSCMLILCEEYHRAIQSKHWDQSTLISTSAMASIITMQRKDEMSHNLSYLISIANDAYRILSAHIHAYDPITIVSSYSFKSELLLKLLQSYIGLYEKAMKYMIRIIYSDMAMLLVDFDNNYTDQNIIRTITSTIGYHMTDIRPKIELHLYYRLLQLVMNVMLKRYLILLKDYKLSNPNPKANMKNSGNNNIVWNDMISKVYSDSIALQNYFQTLIISTMAYEENNRIASNIVAASDSVKTDDMTPDTILSKQYGYLSDIIDLLRLDTSSVAFATVIRNIVYKYHFHLYSMFTNTHNTNDTSIASQPILPDYAYRMPLTLCRTFLSIRPDYNSETESLVLGIYEESLARYITPFLSKGQSMGQSVKRIANVNIFDTMMTPVIYNSTLVIEDIYLSLFTEEETLATSILPKDTQGNGNSSNNNNNTNSNNLLGFSLGSPQGIKFKPVSGLKALGETAATNMLSTIGVGVKRKNEEYALQLYRLLGLEETVDTISASNNGNNNNSNTIPGSESNSALNKLEIDHDLISVGRGNSEGSLSVGSADEFGTVHGTEYHGEGAAMVDCSIIVSSLQVKGLRSASFFSGANPYVAITLGPQRMKTSVKTNSATAEWKSTVFRFKAIKDRLQNSALAIRVYDKEVIRRKVLLGSVNVKLAGIDLRPISSWFALEGGVNGSTGDIYLKIEYEAKL